MSQTSLAIRKKKNDILRAIINIQGNDNTYGVTSQELSTETKEDKQAIINRLIVLVSDAEVQQKDGGYILDVNAFNHISIKR